MKSKLFVVVVLLLSVAMLTTGAFAYFSSTREINGSTISTGTLDLKLNNDCRTGGNTWGDTALAWNVLGMVPGDYVDQTICLKNNGTVGIGRIWYDWNSLMETPAGKAFADKLIITEIMDDQDLGVNQKAALNNMGIYSLLDLANQGGGSWDAYSATYTYPYLDAGDTGWMYMKLQFDPNADNGFQGITLVYNLILEASQIGNP